jgi:hypothetical protein
MFRAFRIEHFQASPDWAKRFAPTGRQLLSEAAKEVRTRLEAFLGDDGAIDGHALQEDWFPQVDADVFLSHSHVDEELALAIAGWASHTFDLKVFVDSAIWGNASDLLRTIDDKYCLNPTGETYDYQKRNRSTSHVHMMLATALAMMIDKTECACVLETKNSITTQGAIGKTESPWLYSEIATMHHIRRRTAEAHRSGKIKVAKALREDALARFNVIYSVPLGSLTALTVNKLDEWENAFNGRLPRAHALDVLYQVAPDTPDGARMSGHGDR